MKIDFNDLAAIVEHVVEEAHGFENPIHSIDDLYEYLEENADDFIRMKRIGDSE
ncbi:hypothetical protein [Lentibacillus amyloliquefaciens]|uniref:hypothetical protein n=1 Tax=Lentibacillus amyloliquefaciens TaxID=1472767 RepID=UPI0012E3A4EF|nr:hypothetical protein [Lentibacillus amyloliquefaciens]